MRRHILRGLLATCSAGLIVAGVSGTASAADTHAKADGPSSVVSTVVDTAQSAVGGLVSMPGMPK